MTNEFAFSLIEVIKIMPQRWNNNCFLEAVKCGKSLACFFLVMLFSQTALSIDSIQGSHIRAYAIKPTIPGRTIELNAFCIGPRGNIWMACRSSTGEGSPEGGLIVVYDSTGLLFNSFPLPFIPQAICFSPNSRLFVAGEGKVARVALNGRVEVEIETPNKETRLNTGIAATEDEVFVACAEPNGDRFAIWRLSPDLTIEGKIMNELQSCCGRFEIQADGKYLILPDYVKFEVGIHDRNGKRLSSFSPKGKNQSKIEETSCQPIKIAIRLDGELLIRNARDGGIYRYSQNGTQLSFIGIAHVDGECKNVSIGFDPLRNWYFMMNPDESQVEVLVLNEEAPDGEKKSSR